MDLQNEPSTYEEWRYALKHVQVLYEKDQLPACLTRCKSLLNGAKIPLHPAQTAALHFYDALSNDVLARSIPRVSPSTLPLLYKAKAAFEAALGSLPEPDTSDDDEPETPSSPTSSIFSRGYTLSLPRTPHFTPLDSCDETSNKRNSAASQETAASLLDTPTPLSKVPSSNLHAPVMISIDTSPIHGTSGRHSSDDQATERYNDHLVSFSVMLQKHIRSTEDFIAETEEIQRERHHKIRRPWWDTNPESRAADMVLRKEKLRKAGWKRTRFDPTRTQKLCREALAELPQGRT